MSVVLDWTDIGVATPVDTVGGEVTIPAFSYTGLTWTGASMIRVQYGFSASRNFIVPRSPVKPTAANYVLCIKYRIGNLVTRFAFWTDDNAVMPNIPLYDGEVIPKNFVIEVWDINGQTEVSEVDETVIQLSLRRVVTDFSVTPGPYQDSTPTIIPVTSISAPLGVGPSLPTTSMKFRYKGSDIVTNPISSWPDSSGNGLNLTQATGANQPALTAFSGGGLSGTFNGAFFDGINDNLTGTGNASDATLYFVVNQFSWFDPAVLFSFIASDIRLIKQTTLSPTIGYFTSGVTPLFTTDKMQVGSWAILTVELSIAGPNRIKVGEFDSSTDGSSIGQFSLLTVGGKRSGASCSKIQVLEIIAYSGIHDSDTQLQVRQYLANFYFGGGPLPLVFGDNNQWLDNPGFPAPVPNAVPPPPPPTPNTIPPDTNIGGALGDETGVLGEGSSGLG